MEAKIIDGVNLTPIGFEEKLNREIKQVERQGGKIINIERRLTTLHNRMLYIAMILYEE